MVVSNIFMIRFKEFEKTYFEIQFKSSDENKNHIFVDKTFYHSAHTRISNILMYIYVI